MRTTAIARRLATLACAALAACDSATETRSFTISLAQQTADVAQGGTAAVAVSIARSNFDGAVSLAASGLPSGVTATFTPASVTGASATLQLSAAGNALPGNATVTVTATGEGVAEQTVTLALSVAVTGSFTIEALDPTVVVAQDGGGETSIVVNRVAGFTGDVSFTVSGAPAGVTVTLDPATATRSARLRLVPGGGAAVGNSTLTVTATSPGQTAQQATVTANVIAPPPKTSVTLTFCAPGAPVWFGYRNHGYEWVQATASGTSYTFDATDRLGIATAFLSGNGANKQVNVTFALRTEIANINGRDCLGSLTFSGSVTGLTAGQVRAVMGPVAVNPPVTPASTAFSLDGVPDRALDLVATRGTLSAANEFTPDRMIIRRSLDLPDGAAIPVLDFGAGESFALEQQNLTLGNLLAGDGVTMITTLWSATSTYGALQSALPAGANTSYLGVPGAQLVAGDVHEMYLDAYLPAQLVGRTMLSYFTTPGSRTETFGPLIATPTVTTIDPQPYLRLRGRITAQQEYGSALRFAAYQEPGGASDTRFVTVLTTEGYLGGTVTLWDATFPLITAPGFNTAWMTVPGVTTAWQVIGYGGRTALIFDAMPVNGDLLRLSDRQGNLGLGNFRVMNAPRLPRGQYFRR